MRVFPLAIVVLIGAVLAPCAALGQSAAFPEAPPEPVMPPPDPPPAPSTEQQPKRGPYQQVLGPYQRNPPKADAKEDNLRPEYALVEPAGIRTHDGLYVRFAGGLGGMSDGIDGSGSALSRGSVTGEPDFSGSASGLAFATEIALGFTPVSSLVIGGGVYTVTAPSSES